MKQQKQQTIWSQFIPLVSIFFFWGFVAASNDILIPVFKKSFTLSQFQSMLVNNAFYAAYFVGAVVFFLVSMKRDVLQIFGYKRTLSFGLCISALGAFLFVPAAYMENYWLFLVALFVVGLGFSVQQIVANPLAIKMGSEGTGAYRLTMAGGVNSLGTTIGPVVLGIVFFGVEPSKDTSLNLDDVKFPFVILGITFILVALFLMMSKIENPDKKEMKESQEKFNVFQYPQLLLGMLAIFLYVGVEVSIVSNLPALLHTDDFGNILESTLGQKKYIILYFISGIGAFILFNFWNYYQVYELHQVLINEGSDIREVYLNSAKGMREAFQETEAENTLRSYLNTRMVGASGAVFGVIAGFATLFPNAQMFMMFIPFPIKAKYLVPVVVVVSVYLGINQFEWDNVAHFAHIGGALVGWTLVKNWNKNRNSIY